MKYVLIWSYLVIGLALTANFSADIKSRCGEVPQNAWMLTIGWGVIIPAAYLASMMGYESTGCDARDRS